MTRSEQVAAVRAFTRFYTRQVELLSESLLGSGFTLAEARVLYELAHRPGVTATDLARELGLDPGYLSRILKGFAGRDLIQRETAQGDARRSALRLTAAGREAFAPLDAASARQVGALLDLLPPAEADRLVGAMGTVRELLGEQAAEPVTLRGFGAGDLGWIAHRQGLLYATEYGWDASFEALVAEIMAAFVKTHDPARERAWIAERGGVVLGSVFAVRDTDEVAKLRLLYVEPSARGLGLGRRLVETCIAFAREAGYRTLTLWTNDILASARRIYETVGFELVSAERHRSFGQDLTGQYWKLTL
ncbi:MAG: MarR family transcriptional regulator [Methylobacteriaceae bacterium]|nr:MarR family transcriptional regulator [Methylobacteriaceae bacterium]